VSGGVDVKSINRDLVRNALRIRARREFRGRSIARLKIVSARVPDAKILSAYPGSAIAKASIELVM
jgi:hypothetical protein